MKLKQQSDQWRSQDFSEGGGHSDDTIAGDPGHAPREFFEIWVSETAFPAFEGTFEQNI